MSFQNFQNDEEPIVDINITPFVDVVLVLLVIFMVTAHFMPNQGINLDLPKTSTPENISEKKHHILTIDKENNIFFDGQSTTLKDLQKNFIKLPQTAVVIRADKSVLYQQVIRIMDILRTSGISDFALELDSQQGE